MAYNALTETEVTSGKPTSTTVFTKVKDNFDNHESRIQAVETGSSTVYPPIILRVNGDYTTYGGLTDILKTTLNFNLTLTGVRLIVENKGTASNTEIDLLYSRSGGSYTSVFNTKPKCNYQDGNDFTSATTGNGSQAGVLNPGEVNLQAGDILRLDLSSAQTGGRNFLVRIDYNKT